MCLLRFSCLHTFKRRLYRPPSLENGELSLNYYSLFPEDSFISLALFSPDGPWDKQEEITSLSLKDRMSRRWKASVQWFTALASTFPFICYWERLHNKSILSTRKLSTHPSKWSWSASVGVRCPPAPPGPPPERGTDKVTICTHANTNHTIAQNASAGETVAGGIKRRMHWSLVHTWCNIQ